jgi:hypothetical protein
MTRKPSNITLSTLHEHPDIARHVGCYVATFSGLEMALWFLYAEILGTDFKGAVELLGEIQSFTVRLNAVERFAKHVNAVDLGKYMAALEQARRVNTFRNLLMHGIYGISSITNELEIQSNGINPTKPHNKAEALTAPFLIEKTAEALALTNFIWEKVLGEKAPERAPQEAISNG